jgi:hypothetical protein
MNKDKPSCFRTVLDILLNLLINDFNFDIFHSIAVQPESGLQTTTITLFTFMS